MTAGERGDNTARCECGHGVQRHGVEAGGCIECRCIAYADRQADEEDTDCPTCAVNGGAHKPRCQHAARLADFRDEMVAGLEQARLWERLEALISALALSAKTYERTAELHQGEMSQIYAAKAIGYRDAAHWLRAALNGPL